MPTNANGYNSRVTDEALEKRYRDTFRSQGGSELVDDLYASGVIIPVVDFTAAAEGTSLPTYLQTAWDFATGFTTTGSGSANLVTTPGFWKVDLTYYLGGSSGGAQNVRVTLTDGFSSTTIFGAQAGNLADAIAGQDTFYVFVNTGQTLAHSATGSETNISTWVRQVATLNGDLVNPTGFTSS